MDNLDRFFFLLRLFQFIADPLQQLSLGFEKSSVECCFLQGILDAKSRRYLRAIQLLY
jgi:hypothetical protein